MQLLIHGDSKEYLKKIKSGSIDLILTDPPYGISRTSGFSVGGIKKYKSSTNYFGEWDVDVDLSYYFKEFRRVLKKGGTLIIFYDVWKSEMIKKSADENKFKQLRVGHWIKSNPVPINSKRNYLSNSTEYFFSMVKGKNPTFNSKYDIGYYEYPICHGKERTDHPTQKPINLILDLVKKHSNSSDLILDPFAGSFTTMEACLISGRRSICIESDEKYYQIGQERFKNLTTKNDIQNTLEG